MKKILHRLSPILLLPLLLSNSPAPGPWPDTVENTLTLSEDGKYHLRNESEDKAIFRVGYAYESHLTEFLEDYSDIFGSQIRTGYFILPGEEAVLPLAFEEGNIPVEEIHLSTSGFLMTDLVLSEQEMTVDIFTEEGRNMLSVKGSFHNPSDEKVTYKVGVYAPTEQGNYYCLDDQAIGQKRSARVAFETEIPEGLSKEDFKAILIYDNDYYSRNYGKPSLFDIIGYSVLGILLFLILLVLGIYLWRRRRRLG